MSYSLIGAPTRSSDVVILRTAHEIPCIGGPAAGVVVIYFMTAGSGWKDIITKMRNFYFYIPLQ